MIILLALCQLICLEPNNPWHNGAGALADVHGLNGLIHDGAVVRMTGGAFSLSGSATRCEGLTASGSTTGHLHKSDL